MNYTKLTSYKFHKGKFIAPLNELASPIEDEKSWVYGRLPEYCWIALILKKYGRKEGFDRLKRIIYIIKNMTSLKNIRMSDFLSASENEKKIVFSTIIENAGVESITPLTVVVTAEVDLLFASLFFTDASVEKRINDLVQCMNSIMDHQSYESTDIRFIVLSYALLKWTIRMSKIELELINKYPLLSHDDEEMKMIRTMIRSAELMVLSSEKTSTQYLQLFWKNISELTECELYEMSYKKEINNTCEYFDFVKDIFLYLQKVYTECDPLNKKIKVLLGIATYSFKRLEEAEKHNLYNTISGRTIIRNIIENYIMMKYLSLFEKDNPLIWEDYEKYGLGQYKLVLARYRESNDKRDSHIDTNVLQAIINEYQYEEFTDMDTNYFNKDNIREKSIKVNEKELYGLYYDYDSAFEHGLWGAIRESSLLKCNNPAHQYHCVPNIESEVSLKSVFPDCVFVVNKTIHFIDGLINIPELLLKEIDDYEQKLIEETNR